MNNLKARAQNIKIYHSQSYWWREGPLQSVYNKGYLLGGSCHFSALHRQLNVMNDESGGRQKNRYLSHQVEFVLDEERCKSLRLPKSWRYAVWEIL
jgi:hypothetical protein